LGISQKGLAVLAGVTVGAVGLWEKGKFRPAANKKAVLVALRKLSKREVQKILAEKKRLGSLKGKEESWPEGRSAPGSKSLQNPKRPEKGHEG
jgi:hypothetical protein